MPPMNNLISRRPDEQKRLATRRLAIVPDEKTMAEIKHVTTAFGTSTQGKSRDIRIKRQIFARSSRYIKPFNTAIDLCTF